MANETLQRIEAISAEIRSIMASNDERGFDEARQEQVAALKRERLELEEQAAQQRLAALTLALNANASRQQRADALREFIETSQGRPGIQQLTLRDANTVVSNGVTGFAPLSIGDIIAPLERGIHFDELGCKIQYNLNGDWIYPVLAAIDASIAGENVAISDTAVSISSVQPTPKRVSLGVSISREALNRSSMQLLDVLTNLVNEGVRRCISSRLFAASAVSGSINGPFTAPGTSRTFGGERPGYRQLVALKGAVDATGVVPDASAAYIMSAALKAELEATPITAGDARAIITDGRINGVPVFASEYVPAQTVYFGYFSYVLIGQFGEFVLGIDASSKEVMKSNQIAIITNSQWDIKAARPEAFGVLAYSANGEVESNVPVINVTLPE